WSEWTANNVAYAISSNVEHFRIKGFIFTQSGAAASNTLQISNAKDVRIEENIFRSTAGAGSHNAIRVISAQNANAIKIANNIIYDFGGARITIDDTPFPSTVIYNNTIVDSGSSGIAGAANEAICINNIVTGSATSDFSATGTCNNATS